MIVLDDKGEPMGDFREERYDLTPQDQYRRRFAERVVLHCLFAAVLIGIVWWVMRVADPLLDQMDEQGRAQAVRWGTKR